LFFGFIICVSQDFGSVKELKPEDCNFDYTYNLTLMTGSRRYMAPEVLDRQPYNTSADVFSFGVLLHEMISMEVPFEGYDVESHFNAVVRDDMRPAIDDGWDSLVKQVIRDCWEREPDRRPNFDSIEKHLNDTVRHVMIQYDKDEYKKGIVDK